MENIWPRHTTEEINKRKQNKDKYYRGTNKNKSKMHELEIKAG